MSARVAVRPEMLHWAVDRSRRVPEDLAEGESAALPEWLSGTGSPTMRQLEAFARKARVPLGYLFLPEPPVERLPIRDFRTTTDGTVPAPSPDLLETVATMQRRQEWLRDHLIRQGEKPLPIVGAADIAAGVAPLVEAMHEQLNLPAGWNIDLPDADATLRTLREAAEAAGVLVSIGGYAGTDTRRTFDVGEFRGFVLVDQYAPLVFVNGADAKTAQLFTLAHELAHVWLGEGGVVNPAADSDRDPGVVESLCNRAAAAFLMPAALLRSAWARVGTGRRPAACGGTAVQRERHGRCPACERGRADLRRSVFRVPQRRPRHSPSAAAAGRRELLPEPPGPVGPAVFQSGRGRRPRRGTDLP